MSRINTSFLIEFIIPSTFFLCYLGCLWLQTTFLGSCFALGVLDCRSHFISFNLFRTLLIFFSLFRVSPYHQFVQDILLLSICLGHPHFINLFRTSLYHQFVQGISLSFSLFRAFPFLQLVQGILPSLVCLRHPHSFNLDPPPQIGYL